MRAYTTRRTGCTFSCRSRAPPSWPTTRTGDALEKAVDDLCPAVPRPTNLPVRMMLEERERHTTDHLVKLIAHSNRHDSMAIRGAWGARL
mgnify:CR=1 FL=1